MNAGIYKASTGLIRQASRMEAIASNLANSSTPGYRRITTSTQSFVSRFHNALLVEPTEDGAHLDRLLTDFSPGPFRPTERALDFAIEGDGFFVLDRAGIPYYTRNGAFAVTAEGKLVNSAGLPLRGNIVLPPDLADNGLTVDHDGTLRHEGTILGRLEMVRFSDPQRLQRVGHTLFATPADMPEEPATETCKVWNRVLEQSNTSVFQEMADMIACMRNYEASQKMLSMQDESEGKMVARHL